MSQVMYATLVANRSRLRRVLRELREPDRTSGRCEVVVHRHELEHQPNSELQLFETGASTTVAKLAAGGALLGAVVGLGFAGLSGVVLFTAAAGTASGALGGLLAGASNADPQLERLDAATPKGTVLLCLLPRTGDGAERARHILQKYRARIVERGPMGILG
jgi:uncharacterized membrane protein